MNVSPKPTRGKSKRSASGRFHASLAHPAFPGRRIRVSAPTAEGLAAKIALVDHLRTEIRLGIKSREDVADTLRKKAASGLKLAAVWVPYTERMGSAHRAKNASVWQNMLAPELGGKLVLELDAARMEAWEDWCQKQNYAPSTVRFAYNELKGCLARQIRHGKLSALPWGGWRPKRGRPPRRFEKAQSPSELVRIVEAAVPVCQRNARSGWLPDLIVRIVVMALCGLRKGEAAALGWDRITLDEDVVVVTIEYNCTEHWTREHPEWDRPRDPTKQRRIHRLLAHPAVILALLWQREMLRRRGFYRADGPVFPGLDGKWRTKPDIVRDATLPMLARAAGLPSPDDWVPHSLRHSMACLEAATGATLAQVAARTGHGSLSALETYLRHTARALVPSTIGLGPEHRPAPTGDVVDLVRAVEAALAVVLEADLGAADVIARHAARRERVRQRAAARAEIVRGEKEIRTISIAELARRTLREPPELSEIKSPTCKEIRRRVYHAGRLALRLSLRETGNGHVARAAAEEAKRKLWDAWRVALFRGRKDMPSDQVTDTAQEGSEQ